MLSLIKDILETEKINHYVPYCALCGSNQYTSTNSKLINLPPQIQR